MTTTALGNIRFRFRDVYDNATAYVLDDIVFYQGSMYRCTAASTGNLPTNASFWLTYTASFNWRGLFNNTATAYAVGDVVKHQTLYKSLVANLFPDMRRVATQVYRCVQAHTTNGTNTFLPGDVAYWQLVSRSTHGNEGSWDSGTASFTENYGSYNDNAHKFAKHMNDGIVGDQDPRYLKGTEKCDAFTYNRGGFITQDGQCRIWGLTSSESTGTGWTVGSNSLTIPFPHNDFFRSTSNGGTGVHSTPDGRIPRVVQWEAGWDWNMVLMNSGEIYHWGNGGSGESGDRSNSARRMARPGGTYTETAVATNTSTHIFRDLRIKRITTSGGQNSSVTHHNMALDQNGDVWTWGYNLYGQLGHNDTTNRNIPTRINPVRFNNNPVVAIWSHGNQFGFNFALDNQNRLYSWGRNQTGQLGSGTSGGNILQPTEVPVLAWTPGGVGTIQRLIMCCGPGDFGAAAILTSTGQVYCTGHNGDGYMMIGSTAQQNSFTSQTSGPGATNSAHNIFFVGSAQYATMFVTDIAARKLWAAGNNRNGFMGVNSSTATFNTAQACQRRLGETNGDLVNVRTVTGLGHSTTDTSVQVVTEGGYGFATGRNDYGQLSQGTTNTNMYDQLDVNGIEVSTTDRVFKVVRMPNSLIGKMADCRSYCYSDGTPYHAYLWVAQDGRTYHAGYSSSRSQTGQRHDTHFSLMQPVNCD